MVWRTPHCPWNDPASELQAKIERTRGNEQEELDEQIATERFDELEARKDETNGQSETDRPCTPDA